MVLTLGAAGAALATLERETGSRGSGGGAVLSGGLCTIRISHMPVRSPACDSLQLLQRFVWVLIQQQRKVALALCTQDRTSPFGTRKHMLLSLSSWRGSGLQQVWCPNADYTRSRQRRLSSRSSSQPVAPGTASWRGPRRRCCRAAQPRRPLRMAWCVIENCSLHVHPIRVPCKLHAGAGRRVSRGEHRLQGAESLVWCSETAGHFTKNTSVVQMPARKVCTVWNGCLC